MLRIMETVGSPKLFARKISLALKWLFWKEISTMKLLFDIWQNFALHCTKNLLGTSGQENWLQLSTMCFLGSWGDLIIGTC